MTGAFGFIGQRIYDLLLTKGCRMRLFTRKHADGLPGEIFTGDIRSADDCRSAMKDVQIVIHAAGEKRDASLFRQVNVQGTRNLITAAQDERVRCFVHFSSVGVLGADSLEKKVFDEDAFCRPDNDYEWSKWEAEQLVHQASTQGLPAVILRPANVFGVGDPEHRLLTLMRTIKRGHFAFLGGKHAVCNYVYVEDVAHACLATLENPRAVGRIYHISDDCLLREFVGAIAEELAVKNPDLVLPEFATAIERKLLRCGRRMKRLRDTSVMARLTALNGLAGFQTGRLREDLGFEYPIGWRRGLSRLIECYRAEAIL